MLRLKYARDQAGAEATRQAAIHHVSRAPLFGLTMLGWAVRVEEGYDIPRMATDGRTIWYSPGWVQTQTRTDLSTTQTHEMLHVYGNHPARCGSRDWELWNWAADMRVALDLLRIFQRFSDFKLPHWHVRPEEWARDLTVEEIYEELVKQGRRPPPSYVPDLRRPTCSPQEDQEFRQRFVQDVAQAQIAEEGRSKKTILELYGESIADRLQELKRCDVPWDRLLQGRLVGAFGHQVASWVPLNRKWLPTLALPSHRAQSEDELLIAVDVSGSIDDDILARFRTCMRQAARRAKQTTVITFDAVIRECATSRRSDDLLRSVKFESGPHRFTDARPVFEMIRKRKPTAVVILTDGFVELPLEPYPSVHWVITPTGMKLPWGKQYRLYNSW